MDNTILTKSEQRTFNILLQKSGRITARDEIAQSVWQKNWLKKYSDWQIDRLIYLLRKKISSQYTITTLRNSGYILTKNGVKIPQFKTSAVEGILPTEYYLRYMNTPNNKRKVLFDLFKSLENSIKAEKILVVNSYSCDNVDTIIKHFPESEIYFSNFDQRAIAMHQARIEKLNINNVFTVFDDLRESIFRSELFDLIINDFRLNFNLTNRQNTLSVNNMYRITTKNGKVLISVVVDPRFESLRFGQNQEFAPINKDKPWQFHAEEKLVRNCFTVPYYKKLFIDAGFKILQEFDLINGKKWHPPYRRFVLTKK